MAQLSEDERTLTLKLVYYGPALSGKTTNLTHLHDVLNPELKGDIMVLDTRNDRTLFFDALPVGFRAPSGLRLKIKLYTVPGQVAHDSTRKAVLSRADGVVFVADSQVTQTINNAEAFENLSGNAARVGLDFDRLPLVVQFNKRDLPRVVGEDEILDRWKATPWPVAFASALTGDGVIETLRTLLERVHDGLEGEYRLHAEHGVDREEFVRLVLGADVAAPSTCSQ
jgi:signal recognition particle receptor subunit beta